MPFNVIPEHVGFGMSFLVVKSFEILTLDVEDVMKLFLRRRPEFEKSDKVGNV